MNGTEYRSLVKRRVERARAIASSGGINNALEKGTLPYKASMTLSEALVLGLIRQEVTVFVSVFGHGSTEIAEVLRVYEEAGVVRTCGVRNEIEAAHAATALRWVTDEKAAVVTSIGPGALQAMAGSLVSASNGVGVWHLYGDETTEDEGPNMQQIPNHEQGLFSHLCQTMGNAYSLHTPLALPTALRRGMHTVDHPHRGGPFYLLLPMNTQCSLIEEFNLRELPAGTPPPMGAAAVGYGEAVGAIEEAEKIVVKVGGGCRTAGPALFELLELADAVAVTSPVASGVVPYDHPRNMTVGGSKGSICGNYAIEHADLLIAVGTRSVCQSDCSRTGYPDVKKVVSINTDPESAIHYSDTIALVGDAAATIRKLNAALKNGNAAAEREKSGWFITCREKRAEWEEFKKRRFANPVLFDEGFKREVLTQPAAIKTALDWAAEREVVSFFDSGDVQATGFQIAEDRIWGRTITDTGASYMGFAVSALLATALATPEKKFYGLAFSGDGSFTMNPQILIDGVEHGAAGCILLLDNRRMAAISSLQVAQYGSDYSTSDTVEVDYVRLAGSIDGVQALHGGYSPEEFSCALEKAGEYAGLSFVYIPVYYGPDELGGMGVFGRWNVGNWCGEVQAIRHKIGL